jgi:hypothetical protein
MYLVIIIKKKHIRPIVRPKAANCTTLIGDWRMLFNVLVIFDLFLIVLVLNKFTGTTSGSEFLMGSSEGVFGI